MDEQDEQYKFKSDPRLVLEVVRNRVQNQMSSIDSLDAKIGAVFAGGSGVIGLLAAVFALRDLALGKAELWTLSVALTAYAIMCLGGLAAWPRRWEIGPDADWVWRESQSLGAEEFIAALISSYMSNWKNNKPWLQAKVWALRVGLVALLIATGCLVAGVVFTSTGEKPTSFDDPASIPRSSHHDLVVAEVEVA